MNILSRVNGFFVKNKERIVKVLRLGNKDVQEAVQIAPFGIDSNPIKDMIAVYSDTLSIEDPIIIGYINLSHIAEAGSVRLFSTDEKGSVKNYIHVRANGNIDIGGDSDNMVRFSKLEEGFNTLKADFNALVSTFNSHIHSGGTVSGNTGTSYTPATASSASIAGAKIDNIKTK